MKRPRPLTRRLLLALLAGSYGGSVCAQPSPMPQPIPVHGLVNPDSLAALIPSALPALLPDSLQAHEFDVSSWVFADRWMKEEEIGSRARGSFRRPAPTWAWIPYTVTLSTYAERPDSLHRQRTMQPEVWEATSVADYRAFRTRSERSHVLEVWVSDWRSASVQVPSWDSTALGQFAEVLPLDRLAALPARATVWLDPYERDAFKTRTAAEAAIADDFAPEEVVPVFVPEPGRLATIFPERAGDRYRHSHWGEVSRDYLDTSSEVYAGALAPDSILVVSEVGAHYSLEPPPRPSFCGVGDERQGPEPPWLTALAFEVRGFSYQALWEEIKRESGGWRIRWRGYEGIGVDSTGYLPECRGPAWMLQITPSRFLCIEPNDADSTLAFGLAAAVDLQRFATLPADTIGYNTDTAHWGSDGFMLPDGSGRRYRTSRHGSSNTRLTVHLPPGRSYADPQRSPHGPQDHLLVLSDHPSDPNTNVFETDLDAFSVLFEDTSFRNIEEVLWQDHYELRSNPMRRFGWVEEGDSRVVDAPLRRAATYAPTVAMTMRRGQQWARLLVTRMDTETFTLVGVGPSEAEAERRLDELARALAFDLVVPR